MKCSNCGEMLDEGASFCPNCGNRVEEKEEILIANTCPVCHTECDNDDAFCPNCGHNLSGESNNDSIKPDVKNITTKNPKNSTSSKKGSGKIIGIIAAIAVAIVALVIAAAFILNHLKPKNGGVGSLVYLKDNEFVNHYGSKEIEIGDRIFKDKDDIYNIGYRVSFTKDGSKLLYPQKYENGTFSLYVSNPHSKRDSGTKIDTEVVSYELAGNNKVVYIKRGKSEGLYVSDFDGNREKIDDNATGFWISDNGKCVLYIQSNNDTLDLYKAELSLKDSPEKIASKIDYVVGNTKNFDLIYYKKNDALYEIENFGDSEKILTHAADVYVKNDEDIISLYVLVNKDELQSIPLKSLVKDANVKPDYDLETMLSDYLTDYYEHELYYYSKRSGKLLLADGNISCCVGGGEAFLYRVLTGKAEDKLSIEELNKMDHDERIDAIDIFKSRNSIFRINVSGYDYAVDNSFEDYHWNEGCYCWYDKSTNTSYLDLIDNENNASVLAKVSLASGGKIEKICDDFAGSAGFVNGRVYYLTESEDDGYELYADGKLIDSDVEYFFGGRDKESLLYIKDSDGTEGTLMIHKEGKPSKISDDVYSSFTSQNGDVALLTDYDEEDLEGDLKLYHNGKTQKIDSGVSFIVNFD